MPARNNNSNIGDLSARDRGSNWMKTGTLPRCAAALLILLAAAKVTAAPVAVDTISPANGITDIFSVTFDGPTPSCTPSDPAWCSFFNGKPGPNRNIIINPDPTTVINGVPNGITPTPAAGSYLDVAVNGAHTQVTLSGGTIALPRISLTIQGGTPNSTLVSAIGAGVVFNAAPQVAALDAEGRAEFLVNLAPAIAVDFSTFSIVVDSCAGPLCSVIPLLTLDMVRYRLVIDFDPTYTTFTSEFIGQTGNNSFLWITMNSADRIAVADSVTPPNDESIPFGTVGIGSFADQTVTISNVGSTDLVLGSLAPPLAPFSLVNDNCSAETLAPATSCTVDVRFAPAAEGAASGSFTIPSDDTLNPSVTMSLSGSGVLVPAPEIRVTDNTLPEDDLLVPFGNVTVDTIRDRTITVTNIGTLDLLIGQVAGLDPVAAPFSIELDADGCSDQTLASNESCVIGVRYAPVATGNDSDSLDIPSNDPNESSVQVDLTGAGIAQGEGGAVPQTPDGADSGFMAIDPATLLLLGGAGLWAWRRRPAR